jgi:hypothetical protein
LPKGSKRTASDFALAMSAEWISAIASVASLFVIALSALAALRQIAHIRTSNQIAALLTFTTRANDPQVRAATMFVMDGNLDRLCDEFADSDDIAALRRAGEPAISVLYFWEAIGSCVVYGMLDVDVVYGTFDPIRDWVKCARFIHRIRLMMKDDSPYDKFEALVAMSAACKPTPLPRVTDAMSRQFAER